MLDEVKPPSLRSRLRRVFAALVAATALSPAISAGADEVAGADTAGLETLWESLWHQSGTPTRLVRWEEPVRWRLS